MARKGTFTATFTHQGRRYYAYGKTQKEADRKAVEKQILLEHGVKTYDSNITVDKWAKQWLEDYKQGTVNSKWYNEMSTYITNHIYPNIGDMRIKDVKPLHINRMLNKYADRSESFQKKLLLVTRQIFDSAEENDLIERNPTKRVKVAPTGDKGGYRTITEEERALTLTTAEKFPGDGLFALIILYCGCRPQEVARLKMHDYDKHARTLYVHEALKSDKSTGTTKSEAGVRTIPVCDYLAERLDRLNKKPDEYMVTALNGSPLTQTSMRNLWVRFKKHMDVENGARTFRGAIVESTLADDLVPYCYRHTFCTDLRDAGVPITVAKVLMGHSSIQMTADIYTHSTDISIEDARKKMNRK